MQMINGLFTGHLSKNSAKVVEEDVYVEFVITHISKNDPTQDFLDNFSEIYDTNIGSCLNNPQWDNIKFSTIIPKLDIKFDVMDIKATLNTIKITKKDTPKELSFKYDLTFIKKQEKDIDSVFATYLKHKDEDEDGKKTITEYEIEIIQK